MKITSKTKLVKIFEKKALKNTLEKFGVPCISCPMAKREIDKLSIGYVCEIYGLPKEEIIKELNKKAERYK
jgi:hypothetical protein